ncbi:MAG: hypothetical protein RL367_1424 [Pseudomonadota bacterium]
MKRVWDVPVRLFHWLLVVAFGFSWWSAETDHMDWHQRSGLALCGLILFRLIWGFVGGSTARFGQFVKGPGAVLASIRGKTEWRGVGHNPLGGWSSLVLIALIAVQVTAGLFAVDIDGIESGPLSHFVDFDTGRVAADIHGINFNLLLGLAGLHSVAIFYYLVIKRRNLIWPMISGVDAQGEIEDALVPAPLWRLGLTIVAAGVLVWWIAGGLRV